MKKCVIYKYVYHDDIIYIGKSDSSLISRIQCHEKEPKFQPYLTDTLIYYFDCNNPAETTIFETFLINKYKPILNKAMKYDDTREYDIEEPEWKFYHRSIYDTKEAIVYKKQIEIYYKKQIEIYKSEYKKEAAEAAKRKYDYLTQQRQQKYDEALKQVEKIRQCYQEQSDKNQEMFDRYIELSREYTCKLKEVSDIIYQLNIERQKYNKVLSMNLFEFIKYRFKKKK